jgi:hypothetical protein
MGPRQCIPVILCKRESDHIHGSSLIFTSRAVRHNSGTIADGCPFS